MGEVTICSDFRAQEEGICHYFHLSPFYLPWSNGTWWHDLGFLILSWLSFSCFTLIKRHFSFSSFSAIRMVSSVYLRFLMFLPPILIPACNSYSLAFLMMCSAHRLNKQGGSRQSHHTPFSILNQSVVSFFFFLWKWIQLYYSPLCQYSHEM